MRRELVEQLVCPVTKDPLVLEIVREDEHGEVIEGALLSERIDFRYPIEDGIPNLLPPRHAAAAREARLNRSTGSPARYPTRQSR